MRNNIVIVTFDHKKWWVRKLRNFLIKPSAQNESYLIYILSFLQIQIPAHCADVKVQSNFNTSRYSTFVMKFFGGIYRSAVSKRVINKYMTSHRLLKCIIYKKLDCYVSKNALTFNLFAFFWFIIITRCVGIITRANVNI